MADVLDLERAACAFALLCMISMVVGLVLGGYGLLGKNLKMFVWASICSLTAGMFNVILNLRSTDWLQ